MTSESLVQLALDVTGYNQKQLGSHLGVSPTQVSKWKKGEYMSFDMDAKLRKLAQIGDLDPDFVLSAGSPEAAMKWQQLITFLARHALESAETGYNTEPLQDELGTLAWKTLRILEDMGAKIPSTYPTDIDMDFDAVWDDDDTGDGLFEIIDANLYSRTILDIYKALNDVYGFYAAYVSELVDSEDLGLIGTAADNIEPCLMDLAATKVNVDTTFAPQFGAFRSKVIAEYTEWMGLVKEKAFQAGTPLRAELMNLIYDSNDDLGHEAEAESLGFNASRIHPDIYMNELLVGMRVIHQVLPAILKKLGIEKEFQLNNSNLSLGR